MAPYAAMIRVIACIVAAAALFVGGCRYGSLTVEVANLKESDAAWKEIGDKLVAEQARSAELNGQVQQLLSRKPAKETIRTLIRENPSDCVRPDVITSGMQNEVDAANQAIAASRDGSSLP